MVLRENVDRRKREKGFVRYLIGNVIKDNVFVNN